MNKIAKLSLPILAFLWHTGIAAAQQQPADLVITNATVHTVNKAQPGAEAVAVRDNRIVAVGVERDIRRFIGKNSKVIDAGGKLVLPGFNDSHVHILGIGNLFSSLDLRDVRSAGEIARKIRRFARYVPKGRWIRGIGWDHRRWNPADLPTRKQIDDASREHPVLLYNSDATMALVNSLALKVAGIDRNRGSIRDGMIIKDSGGRPTGVLVGKAIRMVTIFTKLSLREENLKVIETASNYAVSYGITSLQDMSTDDNILALRELERRGRLKTRVYECSALKDWRKLRDSAVVHAAGSPLVRNGCVKSFSDGSLSNPPRLYENILGADKAGIQVMIHAIGPRANARVLSIFERVIRRNGARDRRFRIEHAQRVAARDLGRFAASGIIASMQPGLFYGTGPYSVLLDQGAHIAFGSDASITGIDPLTGISAALRKRRSAPGNGRALTAADVIRLYTLGGAYAEYQEKEKGSIEVGKLADLVILSKNILESAPADIPKAFVMTTIVGGKIVYQREA